MTGYELLIYVVVAIVFAAISYVLAVNAMGQGAMQDPRNDMQVTSVKEGSPIPVIYGTVRFPGNVIWYGNLKSVKHYASGGGKGGGSKKQTDGFMYYIDVWEGLCVGPIEIIDTYVADDRHKEITAAETVFNDGDDAVFPDFINSKLTEHNVTLSGAGPTYSLGKTNIIPNTVSISITFPLLAVAIGYKDNPVVTTSEEYDAEKDTYNTVQTTEATAQILGPGGALMTGWSLNYSTGVLTLNAGMAGATVNFWRKLSGATAIGQDVKNNEGVYAEQLNGIAHIAYKQWSVGLNITNIPSTTVVAKRTLASPISYANMSNGANPAAVIYDLLTDTNWGGQINPSQINTDSFNAAATIWYNKGYGLNIIYKEQVPLRTMIEQVLGWVGGSFYMDQTAKYCLHAFSDSETAIATLDEYDYAEFILERPSWESTHNDIRINWVDAKNDYVRKTYALFDSANYRVQGCISQLNVDLLAFNDAAAVARRGWELLKTQSYPSLKLQIKVPEKSAYSLFVGGVVDISHSLYSITNMKFRILSMDFGDLDSLSVSMKLEEIVECNIDGAFGSIGDTSNWSQPSYLPAALAHQAVFELPWNPLTKDTPAYAVLGNRVGHEDNCYIELSTTSSSAGYENVASFTSFSQQGVLDITYPATTYSIDDDTGIIYTPHNNDLEPGTVDRSALFDLNCFLVIDSEIMAFQSHLPYGDGDQYQILGVVRGLFGTTVASHTAGANVWIFYASDQLLDYDGTAQCWVKLLTACGEKVLRESAATAITVTPAQKAMAVAAPDLIQVEVSGTSAIVTWWPVVREFNGAGMKAEDAYSDSWPFEFDGDFEYTADGVTVEGYNSCQVTITISGSTTFSVRQRVKGVYSSSKSITFPQTDGTYLSDIGAITY